MALTETAPDRVVTRDMIEGYVGGDVSGQVAFGRGNIQVGAVHGGVVNIVAGGEPTPSLRSPPVHRGFRPSEGVLGREQETQRALAGLRQRRPVGVHGPPGVGKTTLLVHLANHPGLPARDRVVYKRARRLPVSDVLQLLFDTFYESDVRYKFGDGRIREHLASVACVVLLDDVDLDRDDAEELLGSVPGAAFVVASTERCLWGDATALALPGLPEDAGLALVARELGRDLAADERAPAAALHRALNGHPLRLLQAASLVRDEGATFAGLAHEPAEAARPVPAPVQATLTPAERDILGLLAAHGGAPVHTDHVIDLTGRPDAPSVLRGLLDRRLVQAHSPRYSLTVPLDGGDARAFDVDAWDRRAVEHWTAWAAVHGRDPNAVAEEIEPLLEVVERAREGGRWTETVALVRAVDPGVVMSRQWGRWKSFLDAALTAARRAGDRAGEAWSLHQSGVRALCLGDERGARSLLRQALAIRRALGDGAGADVTRYHLDLLRPRPPVAPSGGSRLAGPFLLGGLGLLLAVTGALVLPRVGEGGERRGELAIDVAPGRLEFDPVSRVRLVEVRNRGGGDVRVQGLRIDGPGRDQFTVVGETCSAASLSGGTSCSVAVRFLSEAPAAPARLFIAHSAGRPATVALVPAGEGRGDDTSTTTTVPTTTVPTTSVPTTTVPTTTTTVPDRPLGGAPGPLLVSATGDDATGLVRYEFDSELATGAVDPSRFHLYTAGGARLTAASASVSGRTALARFAPSEVARSTTATVDGGAVAGVDRRPNIVCDAPAHDVVLVPGATSAPDLVGVRAAPGQGGTQVLVFEFDQPVQLGLSPGAGFEVVDADNVVYEATAVASAGDTAVGASFSNLLGSTVVRGVVEAGAVRSTGPAPVANPLQSIGIGPATTADRTTAADLVAAGTVGPHLVRFTFDQPVAVPAAQSFRIFDASAVEQAGATAQPVKGRPESVDVSFSAAGPVPPDTAVGASVSEGGVVGDLLYGVPLLGGATVPVAGGAPQPAGKASVPLPAVSFQAGRTALPDLVAVRRATVAGRPSVSFTFDQPLPLPYRAAPTSRLALSLHQPDGRSEVAGGSAAVMDGGATVVLTGANLADAADLASAVRASVSDTATAEREVREACAPIA